MIRHAIRPLQNRALRNVVFLLGMASLGDCANDESLSKKVDPPQGPIPSYKSIISEGFPTMVKRPETYASNEISGAQQVFSLKGWAWLVCIKGNNGGQPI
jgi:hypothetical protein